MSDSHPNFPDSDLNYATDHVLMYRHVATDSCKGKEVNTEALYQAI